MKKQRKFWLKKIWSGLIMFVLGAIGLYFSFKIELISKPIIFLMILSGAFLYGGFMLFITNVFEFEK